MEYKAEELEAILPEFLEIAKSHNEELRPFDHLVMNPDIENYRVLFSMGVYKIYSVRDNDKLVGYAGFFVSPSMQHKDSIQAVQDLIYLNPELRGKGIGHGFIQWIDDQLKYEGVDIVYHHTKNGKSFGGLLESLNYKLIDYVYARRL